MTGVVGALDVDVAGLTPPAAQRRELTRRLVAVGRLRSYRRGEFVYREGDEGTSIHLVSAGRFAAQGVSYTGANIILALHGPGELFGELAQPPADGLRPFSVAAVDAGEALMIGWSDFQAVRRDTPLLGEVVEAVLARRAREAAHRIVEMVHTPAAQRIRRVLLHLVRVYAGDGPEIRIRLSQQQIAGMAGTSRDSVNRVFARGEREGWLRIERSGVVITDVGALTPGAE